MYTHIYIAHCTHTYKYCWLFGVLLMEQHLTSNTWRVPAVNMPGCHYLPHMPLLARNVM